MPSVKLVFVPWFTLKEKSQTHPGIFLSKKLCSSALSRSLSLSASLLLSALNEKWGDTRHPSPWKERLFEKHSFPPHNGRVGGGWVGGCSEEGQRRHIPEVESLHQPSPDKIFLPRAHSFEPQSSLYVILLTRTPISMSYELLFPGDRRCFTSVFLCGPDSCGQCDLFSGVIFWTSGRWQAEKRASKNTRRQLRVRRTNHTEKGDSAGGFVLAPLAASPRTANRLIASLCFKRACK